MMSELTIDLHGFCRAGAAPSHRFPGSFATIRAAGLDGAQVDRLSDTELQARVYGPPTRPTHQRAVPDCAYLHAERRKPGVTLELLHLEYLEQHPDGYRYTQFCECYRRWLRHRGLSMRQVHRSGEKLFVDYAEPKPSFLDPATGERITAELFVAVLGASNYTYAEATLTQQVPGWIASHQRAFAFPRRRHHRARLRSAQERGRHSVPL